MSKRHVVYPGKDLESMSFAVKYHRWLLDEFRPFVGRRLVEVGAGTGSFSKMLLELAPESLTLVEPSEMFKDLIKNVGSGGDRTAVRHFHSTFDAVADEIRRTARPDTIIYVNVLEHIGEDERELSLIHETLEKGGVCLIFVPAVRALYSRFDRSIGHIRRYTKRELETKVHDAGFKILKCRNFDAAGVLPWFVKYRLLRATKLDQRAVKLYDDMVVPIARRVEPRLRLPIGKNILLVAQK